MTFVLVMANGLCSLSVMHLGELCLYVSIFGCFSLDGQLKTIQDRSEAQTPQQQNNFFCLFCFLEREEEIPEKLAQCLKPTQTKPTTKF